MKYTRFEDKTPDPARDILIRAAAKPWITIRASAQSLLGHGRFQSPDDMWIYAPKSNSSPRRQWAQRRNLLIRGLRAIKAQAENPETSRILPEPLFSEFCMLTNVLISCLNSSTYEEFLNRTKK
jgi:hypothetical protein